MKKLRILSGVLVRTHAHKVLLSFLGFFFLDALLIRLVEPGMESYGQALWYCYAVMSTAGFGDIVAATLIGRLASVALTLYALVALAIITGVIVNFYTQMIQIQQKNTLASFADRLEQLPDLSREELARLSEEVKRFRTTLPKDK